MVEEAYPSVHIYHLLLLVQDGVNRQLDLDLRLARVAFNGSLPHDAIRATNESGPFNKKTQIKMNG